MFWVRRYAEELEHMQRLGKRSDSKVLIVIASVFCFVDVIINERHEKCLKTKNMYEQRKDNVIICSSFLQANVKSLEKYATPKHDDAFHYLIIIFSYF